MFWLKPYTIALTNKKKELILKIYFPKCTVTRKFPVNSNGWYGEVAVQLSLFGLLLLTQPLHSSEQHTRANLEFSSNFAEPLVTFFFISKQLHFQKIFFEYIQITTSFNNNYSTKAILHYNF